MNHIYPWLKAFVMGDAVCLKRVVRFERAARGSVQEGGGQSLSLWPVGLLGQIWGSVAEAAVPTPVPSLQEGSLGTDWSWLVPGSDPVKVMTLSALAGLL